MAIRFLCGGCSQPIEVDDEWANRTVACPYCRRTVTAPAESIMTNLNEVPTASPAWSESVGPSPMSGGVGLVGPTGPRLSNGCATAAAILAGVMVAFAVAGFVVVRSHRDEFMKFAEFGQSMSFSESMNAAQQRMQEEYGGQFPDWLLQYYAVWAGIGAAWIATVVCGIIGVRTVYRRAWAILSLVLAGLVPLVFCCGTGIVATL